MKLTLPEVAQAIANDLYEVGIIDTVMLREYEALCISPLVSEKVARQKHTQQALASLALEGIYPSKSLLADIELLDAGQLSDEEFLARTLARVTDK